MHSFLQLWECADTKFDGQLDHAEYMNMECRLIDLLMPGLMPREVEQLAEVRHHPFLPRFLHTSLS